MLMCIKWLLIMAEFVNKLKNMVERFLMWHLQFNIGLNLVIKKLKD
jgi:hypothetical protein